MEFTILTIFFKEGQSEGIHADFKSEAEHLLKKTFLICNLSYPLKVSRLEPHKQELFEGENLRSWHSLYGP
jgi:hypothetical protein